MGITNAIGNAMSGLRANSRSAEIVARNIANAGVEGYAAKSLALGHETHGGQPGGVRVDGVLRAGDPLLTAARRSDEAEAGRLSAEADTLRRIADLALDPAGGDSLQSRYLAFENALRALADTPESPAMQRAAADTARGLAVKLNTLSTEARRIRMDADREIQRQVETVNRALRRIEGLNKDIQSAAAAGRDSSALEDERQRQIDLVNGVVPIKSAQPLPNGGMHILAQGGQSLMNGTTAHAFSFETGGQVTGSNDLGGVTHLGRTTVEPARIGLGGGSLEAAFRARDLHARGFSEQLDAMARDLVERFQDVPGFEAPGGGSALGLFVDRARGADARFPTVADSFTPAPATQAEWTAKVAEIDAQAAGLAGRIAVNALIDPRQGGDAERLVTGESVFAETSPPAEPRLTLPSALYAAMREARDPRAVAMAYDGGDDTVTTDDVYTSPYLGDALGLTGAASRVDMVTEWATLLETEAGAAETEASFRRGAAEALREQELGAQAVDTDEEMRRLLQIEKAYAANARVLQVADQMLATMLEI